MSLDIFDGDDQEFRLEKSLYAYNAFASKQNAGETVKPGTLRNQPVVTEAKGERGLHGSKITHGKKVVVAKYMSQYDTLIKETIRKNNRAIYKGLNKFLSADQKDAEESAEKKIGLQVRGVGGQGFGGDEKTDSQVPTCLVITSNESSTSIDTQFGAMCEELKASLKSINLVLDEKKCGNIKQTFEHIQQKLREELGLPLVFSHKEDKVAKPPPRLLDPDADSQGGGDFVLLKIPQDDTDEEEDEFLKPENLTGGQFNADPGDESKFISSHHVSTIMDPSFSLDESARMMPSNVPEGLLGEEEKNEEMEDLDESKSVPQVEETVKNNKKGLGSGGIVRTRGQKEKAQRAQGQSSAFLRANFKRDEMESNLAALNEAQNKNSDIIKHETFYGIKSILEDQEINTLAQPILLIIKNIKSFETDVLNDLIHHLKIYRGSPHFLNLNLMLGVQNNSKEEIHLKVSIQNCVKLSIKTFYFPSMKNIIFEVVFKMLGNINNILVFQPQVVQQLIETINLFGMSVDKFKRILKVTIAEHIYQDHDFFFLHNLELPLMTKKVFEQRYRKDIYLYCIKSFDHYYGKNHFPDEKAKKEQAEWISNQCLEFIIRRRHWYKAFEIVQELVVLAYVTIERNKYRHELQKQFMQKNSVSDLTDQQKIIIEDQLESFKVPDNELKIFRYQFVLNYLSKPTNNERIKYLMLVYPQDSSYKDTIYKELIKVLKEKTKKEKKVKGEIQQERTSKFTDDELQLVTRMLTGEQTLIDFEQQDQKQNVLSQSGKIKFNQSISRHKALLGGTNKQIVQKQQNEVDENIREAFGGLSPAKQENSEEFKKREELRKKFRPKDDDDFKKMFWKWIGQFHDKWLSCEFPKNVTRFQVEFFYVKHNNFDEKINPDIGGSMTKSIMDSQRILGIQQPQQTFSQEFNDAQSRNLKDHDFQGIENVNYAQENITILLEICKFYGRDINIMEMFQLFKNILRKGSCDDNYSYKDEQIKQMFQMALSELKYMGYLSQTRQSTFIFRKNYFGKAKHQKHTIKTDFQNEKDHQAINRQFHTQATQ